jgi:predicted metal-dependent HD superfamily phosphohydrolase
MSEETNSITEPVNPLEVLVRSTLAGSLSALCPNRPADSQHPEVVQYMEMMGDPKRLFHNISYIGRCLMLLKEIPNYLLEDLPHLIAGILFHKSSYDPRKGFLSLRKSCEIAMGYYPGEKIVALFSLIKATRFGALIKHRYHDDRAYIADISLHVYTLPWDEFRQAWGLILQEFNASGCKPVQFKKITAKQLRKMLIRAESFGLFQTKYFRDRFEEQAVANIKQLSSEVSS